MSSPIQALLNRLIKNILPEINSGIRVAIKSNNLDPWGQIAHGTNTFGYIDFDICEASVSANYNIKNMIGLSYFNIDSLEITSAQEGTTPSQLVGAVSMNASVSYFSSEAGGGFEAKCGLFQPSIGISGKAIVDRVTAVATGSFTANIDKDKICLSAITLSTVSINYEDLDIYIDELGLFNSFLRPLIDEIAELFKWQIRGAISSAITPIINNELINVMPQYENL